MVYTVDCSICPPSHHPRTFPGEHGIINNKEALYCRSPRFFQSYSSPLSRHVVQLACPQIPHPRTVPSFILPPAAVADIEVIADETVLSCPATGVTITVEFDVTVSSVESTGAGITGADISGDNRWRVG